MRRDIRVGRFAPTAPPACALALAAVLGSLAGCSGGRPPSGPGVTGGRLAPCPDSPNCVSSEAVAERRVEPLRYSGGGAEARARLLEVLSGMERARVVQSTDEYLHAEFRSAVFGFVDEWNFISARPGPSRCVLPRRLAVVLMLMVFATFNDLPILKKWLS